MQGYLEFLERKIKLAEPTGFEVDADSINAMLMPHQKDIVLWGLAGGRRAVFANFGLGKTFMQLEIGRKVFLHTSKPFLVGLPLGVRFEFELDADKLGYKVRYVRNQAEAMQAVADGIFILITNYERIRTGSFDAGYFGGVSFDEASVLRSLDTQTTDYILQHFCNVPYRFVCTATPSPNEFTEILNYAHFLGIMDRGQALTRFFQRDSTKAGNLSLYPHKAKEFWMWVSSWAVFITKPSDLGYSDEGYDLPDLEVHYHMVKVADRGIMKDRDGQQQMFRNVAASLPEAAKEKRESIQPRIDKLLEIISLENPGTNFLLWHHLEAERLAVEKALPGVKSVYGSQDEEEREDYLIGFGAGKYQYLSTKPSIAGQGCNFQRWCHNAVFLGIDYNFNDFIQALHRIYRFMQLYRTNIHIIYTDAEEQILKTFLAKWARHKEMVQRMTDIIKEYGLNNISLKADLKRTLGVDRKEAAGNNYRCIHNDTILETADMPDNSVDLVVTSIPFSDQYEYCESYHDMGHNDGDAEFFEQMDYLTPNLLRVTKPGRIACIHVKDRIRYSYQNGQGFTSLNFFHADVIKHFTKHGWYGMGMITITTDVVMENNQTYRLGWTEQCKDATKMGVGLPEYLLIFRKPTSDTSNAYADVPVTKSKEEYNRARWQLDAHAYHRSSGDRLLYAHELRQMDLDRIAAIWKAYTKQGIYNFNEHVRICENLDSVGKLSATFMSLPTHSNTPHVWDDVSRMHTLNSNQTRKKQEKHVCPLQFDIVDRCITRYSNPGETVYDPFGGIMTVPYRAIKLDRKGVAVELNENYWRDGIKYCRDAEQAKEVPSLFDFLPVEKQTV